MRYRNSGSQGALEKAIGGPFIEKPELGPSWCPPICSPPTPFSMPSRIRILVVSFCLVRMLPLQAVTTPAPTDFVQVMADATAVRATLAESVAAGALTSAAAVNQLRALASPTGLKLASNVDLAYGARDIARRLVSLGKPEAAEAFFKEAEKALALQIRQTPDAQAREKADYLKNLAEMRAQHLRNPAQARLDIDQAIALQPDDTHLQAVRANLSRENAEFFKN